MRLVRGVLPGAAETSKRKGGRRARPALLGLVGAGAAGMAMAARRRKRAGNEPAATQPQPEAPTEPSSATEAPRSEDGD